MRGFNNNFPEYVANVFKDRLQELGLSQYKFIGSAEHTNQPTLTRMLKARGSTNIKTLAHYAEKLGLEIIIRPKQSK